MKKQKRLPGVFAIFRAVRPLIALWLARASNLTAKRVIVIIITIRFFRKATSFSHPTHSEQDTHFCIYVRYSHK
jgi:hypothetical protein